MEASKPSLASKVLTAASFIISIIALFVTVYFSSKSVQLSLTANDLAKKYGENRDQLTAIDDLITKQQWQIEYLTKIIDRLDLQNQYSKGLLLITKRQELLANENFSTEEVKNFNNFQNAFSNIKNLIGKFRLEIKFNGFDYFQKAPDDKKIVFLDQLQQLLKNELTNPYLFKQYALYLHWKTLDDQIPLIQGIIKMEIKTQTEEQNKIRFYYDPFMEQFNQFYTATSEKINAEKNNYSKTK